MRRWDRGKNGDPRNKAAANIVATKYFAQKKAT